MKSYWTNQYEEDQSLKQGAMISALIELKELWRIGILYEKVNPFKEGVFYYPKQKLSRSKDPKSPSKIKGKFRQQIDSKITISDLAREYFPDNEIRGEFILCPFHEEKTPSLHFNDIDNVFKCWGDGCGAKGDIVEFYRLILEMQKRRMIC